MKRTAALVVVLAAIAQPMTALASPPNAGEPSTRIQRLVNRVTPSARENARTTAREFKLEPSAVQKAQARAAKLEIHQVRVQLLKKGAIAAAIAGATYGITLGVSAGDVHEARTQESATYAQVQSDAPAGSAAAMNAAKFNALASQIHKVTTPRSTLATQPIWPLTYQDPSPASTAAYHQLASAVLRGDVGSDASTLITAVSVGQNLSHDMRLRGGEDQLATKVDTDTALVSAKLLKLYGPGTIPQPPPTVVSQRR